VWTEYIQYATVVKNLITLPQNRPVILSVLGILSAADHNDQRNAIRKTWLCERSAQTAAVFLIGDPAIQSPTLNGDELLLPCPDDYAHLTCKTMMFMRWALENFDAQSYIKCDDDTYLCIERLQEVLASPVDYRGAPTQLKLTRRPFPVASGGAGYVLSQRAAVIVASSLRTYDCEEDVQVARALFESGVALTADDRFEARKVTPFRLRPDAFSAHYVTPAGMRSIYRNLKGEL